MTALTFDTKCPICASVFSSPNRPAHKAFARAHRRRCMRDVRAEFRKWKSGLPRTERLLTPNVLTVELSLDRRRTFKAKVPIDLRRKDVRKIAYHLLTLAKDFEPVFDPSKFAAFVLDSFDFKSPSLHGGRR